MLLIVYCPEFHTSSFFQTIVEVAGLEKALNGKDMRVVFFLQLSQVYKRLADYADQQSCTLTHFILECALC